MHQKLSLNCQQLHTSYSSLGRDFKNIFDELVKHLNAQKVEANDLRKQLSKASQAAVQADADISARLQACLTEEREQAVLDRQSLLSQITDLINRSGEQQDARWVSKIDTVRSDIGNSTSKFQTAEKLYSEGMDVWSQKESLLVEEVLRSRETLKSKMKKDWNVSCSQ